MKVQAPSLLNTGATGYTIADLILELQCYTFINNLSGVQVADTATALANARTIALSGDVTATGVSFDGTGNITLSTTIAANSVALGTDTTGNYVATIVVQLMRWKYQDQEVKLQQ